MKKVLTLSAVGLCAGLAGCELSSGPERVACETALLSLGATTGDTVTTQTGLRYIDIEVGSGAAAASGDGVAVHYSLYLPSSGAFLQSSCGGNTLDFPLGVQAVIPGFEEGIIGMREGGVRRLIIPPELGYGSQARPGIPANSTLLFDVQLANVD